MHATLRMKTKHKTKTKKEQLEDNNNKKAG